MNRILLVDDHEIMRRGLKEILLEAYPSAAFGEAGSYPEAIQCLQTFDWDLMLLDVSLPGRSGLEVLAESRRLQPNLAVLVLSAYEENEFAIRAFKLGASAYLTKGSAPDELMAAVKKIESGGRYVSSAMAEVLAGAIAETTNRPPHETLSARELQVLQSVASGKTIKEIASDLGLSEKTIGTYRSRIAAKLKLSSNIELTRYALRHHLTD